MNPRPSRSFDPRTFKALTFHDAVPRFPEGADSPRAYFECCMEMIKERERIVKAFVALNETGARAAADESTARWKAGRPLSVIDGMPIGIKDLLETKDMPTQMGCEAFRGNFPKRDNAAVWALREAGAVILGKTATAELGGSHPPATTNPLRPGAYCRWVIFGFRRRGRRAHASRCYRHPGRWLHHSPSRILRQLRAETHPGRHQPRRAAGHQYEHTRRACGLHRGHVAGRDRDR